jgi:hypothetical protein
MTGRIRGEAQATEFDGLAKGHLTDAVPRAQAVLIQPGRRRRGERKLVPRDVIGMRMRNKAPRLATAHVDAELRESQEKAGVVVEHWSRFRNDDFGLRIGAK